MNNIWKRSLSMMLALVMVFSLLPVNVLATDAEPVDEHTHEYVSAVTAAATCTEDGVMSYACECGDSYTEAITAAGHTYAEGVCGICGAEDPDYVEPTPVPTEEPAPEVTPEPTPAVTPAPEHSHDYESAVTAEATCTAEGELTYTCGCGESYTEAIGVVDHAYADGVCTVCGGEDPDYVAPVPELSGELREVYFVNAEGWEEVYAAWSFDEEYFEDCVFPGEELSAEGELENVFVLEVPVEADAVLLNDGIEVTEELLKEEQEAGLTVVHEQEVRLNETKNYYDENGNWLSYETVLAAKRAEEAAAREAAAKEAEAQASAQAVAAVQAMIDALPTAFASEAEVNNFWDVTAVELDAAIEALTAEQQAQLDTSKYDAAMDAAASFTNPEFDNAGTWVTTSDPYWDATATNPYIIHVGYGEADEITKGQLFSLLDQKWDTETLAYTVPIVNYTIGLGGFKYGNSVVKTSDESGSADLEPNQEYEIYICTETSYKKGKETSTFESTGCKFIVVEESETVNVEVSNDEITVNYLNGVGAVEQWESLRVEILTKIGTVKTVGAISGDETNVTDDKNNIIIKFHHKVDNIGNSFDIDEYLELNSTNASKYDETEDRATFTIGYGSATPAIITVTLNDPRNESTIKVEESATAQYYTQMDAQQAKKAIFDAVYVSSTPALNVNDVTIEVQVVGDYWTDVTGEISGYKAIDLLKELGDVHARIVFAGNSKYKPVTSDSVSVKLQDDRKEVTIENDKVTVSYQSETILDDVIDAIGANYTGVSYLNDNDALTADALRAAAAESKGNTLEVTVKLAQGDAEYKPFDKTVTVSFTDAWYSVSWYQENGKDLVETTDALIGTAPTHDGIDKDATAQYTYTFAGWNPVSGVENGVITGDASYKASFDSVVNKYTVTFVDGNGEIVSAEEYDYGTPASDIVIPETATKNDKVDENGNVMATYTFDGWADISDDFVVIEDVGFEATFTEVPKVYTIIFKIHDGEEKLPVEYGLVPEYTTPDAYEEGDKYYSFQGWNPEVVKVTGEATYEAVYTDAPIFKVTFDANGGKLEEDNVKRIIDGEKVSAIKTSREGYRFDGWYLDGKEYDFATPVTADITLTAKWVKQVTVTFDVEGIEAQTFDIGGKATMPANPIKDQAIFAGWYLNETEFNFDTPVSENITLTAKWLADVNKNEVDDTEETITIKVNKAVEGDAGDAVAIKGAEVIEGNQYLFDSKNPTVTITATPVVVDGISTTYVKSIGAKGAAKLSYENFVATETVEVSNGNEIVVTFEAVPDVKSPADVVEYNFYTRVIPYKDIYNSVVEAPKIIDENTQVEYEYFARPAMTHTVSIDALDLDNSVKSLLKTVGLNEFSFDMDELWLPLDAKIKDGVSLETAVSTHLTKDRINGLMDIYNAAYDKAYNDYITANGDDVLDKLAAAADGAIKGGEAVVADIEAIYNVVYESAYYYGVHEFGYNAAGAETVDEQIKITYTDDSMYWESEATVTLKDSREAAYISGSDVTLAYKNYTDEDLLANFGLVDVNGNPVDGEVYSAELTEPYTFEGKNVSETAYQLLVKFAGNEAYRPAEKTFNITVEKAGLSVDLPNLEITYGEGYDIYAGVGLGNAYGDKQEVLDSMVEIIIGLDVADLEVSAEGDVSGVGAHVQIMLPQDDALATVFKTLGLDIYGEEGETLTFDELQDVLSQLNGLLGEFDSDNEIVSGITSVLESVTGLVDLSALEISFGGKYPTDIGVYLYGAVSTSSNYETGYDVAYMIIKPATTKVEMEWNYVDENYIFSHQLLQYFDLGAHTDRPELDDEVVTLFVGVDENGEFVTSWNPTELSNGAYVEIAFLIDFGNETYYAEPLVRPVVLIPNIVDTQIQVNGEIANEYLLTFNNEPVDVELVLNTELDLTDKNVEKTVKYYGLQTNTNTYDSEDAPKHAGVYAALATVVVRDANDELIAVGADAAVIAIEPTEATVDVADQILYINEVIENIYFKDQVIATSSVAGLTPDTTVISAGIDTDGSFTEEGLSAVRGTVNVDFPKWVDALIDQYAPSVKNGITLSELETKLINKLPEISDALAQEGATEEVINSFSNLIETVNKVLAELPDEVTLSFKDDACADRVGAFAVIAVVTDSDHIPAVDAGVLVVLPEVTQVELKWNYEDANDIWTREILKSYNMYATAYNVESGKEDEEATGKITYKFISTDETGEITIYDSAETLPYGAYIELAYIELMVDSYMTVSDMIARPIVFVPQVYDVQLLDAAGNANNDLLLTFNNRPQGFGVKVTNMDGKVIEPGDDLTVTYVGIEANTKTYNSTEKPVHTGAYMAVATYIERDAEGNVLAAGMDTGVLVIQPTEATIIVDDKAEVITNVNDKVYFKAQVTAASTVAGLTPDTTVISAAVNTDGSFSEEGLAAVRGTVNVDFPRWADELIAKYAPSAVEGMTVADFSDKVLSKLPVITELMAQYGATEEMVRSFTNLFNNINAVLAEVPEEVTLSFKDDAYADRVGVYLVVGVVTDSDHIPAMDTGVLVITPDVQIAELAWNEIDLNGIITQPALESFDFSAYDALDRHSDKISYILYGVDDDGETVYIEGSNADYEAFAAKCAALENGAYTQIAYVPGEVNSVIPVAEVIMRSFVVSPQNVFVNVEDTTVVYDGTGKTAPVTAQYADGSAISKEMLADNLTVRYVGLETVNGTYDDYVAPTNVGVYAVIAEFAVRDENDVVYFGVNTGYLTITPAQAKLEMLDGARVCPDSEYTAEDLYKVDPAGLHVVTVIVDENNNVNIILPELPGVDAVEPVSITVDGGKADVKALISRLPEQVQAALAALYVGTMNSEIGDELQAIIDKLEQVNVLSINGALPTEEGTYKTYGFTAGRNYVVSLPDSFGQLTVGHQIAKVEANDPTCTEEGNIEHYECENCDKMFSDAEAENEITAEDVAISAKGHSYLAPEFDWAEDYSSATAIFTCPNCDESTNGHTMTVECRVVEARTEPTCTENGSITYVATVEVNGVTYADIETVVLEANGHSYGEATFTWSDDYSSASATVTCPDCEEGTEGHSKTVECEITEECKEPTSTENGYIKYTATVEIDGKVYTDTKTVELSESKEGLYPIYMDPASHETIMPNGTIYVDGIAYTMDENCVAWIPMDDALLVTTYEYNMDSEDPHEEYPIHMYVWELSFHGEEDAQWNTEESYTAERVEELDDIMLYAGTSIRMTGKQGIRVITSIDSERRSTLINSNLAGFSLKEYGTMFCWAQNEDGTPKAEPTQGAATSYAYLKGQRDSIFYNTGSAIQYTGMLVDLQDELLDDDLLFRPYMVLEKNGVEYILYGGTLQRSIGYVAYQNRAYNPSPAAYDFIWNIIHIVYGDKYDADYRG